MSSGSRRDMFELFFTAYGRINWRDKLWKLIQNLARVTAWAAAPQQQARSHLNALWLHDSAAALARGISSSRKGFRMGKWLRPLERLLTVLFIALRHGSSMSIASIGGHDSLVNESNRSVHHHLTKCLARSCMVGYGVWDNLVFLSSIGALGGRARDRAKVYKIRSHTFRFFGNLLDAVLAFREWSRLHSLGQGMAGSNSRAYESNRQSEDRQWRGDTRPDKLDVRFSEKVTVAAKSRQCLESSDPLALQRARDKTVYAFFGKCCSAFESFSHGKFSAWMFGRDINPGLIGLSGILSSSLVLYVKWPETK